MNQASPFPFDTVYQSQQGCVVWQGVRANNDAELKAFIQGPVAARFHDIEGGEVLHQCLQGLSLTGMGQQSLEAVLAAEVPETRDWAAGEALAEAVLEARYKVELPWNNERDKRNPFASLPGADIVGFQRDGDSYRLVLGEVKCSSEARWPPQVMSGRSRGLSYQIDNLTTNQATFYQLLKWLMPRVKGTAYETAFKSSCTSYFNSNQSDLVLFGILVRDQQANEADLRKLALNLASNLTAPTSCYCIALYLPWPIAQLPQAISQRGAT